MTGFASKKAMANAKVSDLSYEIESLFVEGHTDAEIAEILQITIDEVAAWMTLNGLAVDEDFSPHGTINS
jgi:DNA-directed RNA polymerase specialized sigma24 family protein